MPQGACARPLDLLGRSDALCRAAHAAGVKVIDQVGSVADAQRAAQVGVDAIVAQGVEAGGHIAGEVTTMALMPCVVDAVAPLPVVAAGGIADARGLRSEERRVGKEGRSRWSADH